MARTSIERLGVGLLMLGLIMVSLVLAPDQQNQAQAQAMPPVVSARVFNEAPQAIHVLVTNQGRQILFNSQMNPGGQLYFQVPARTCREVLRISLDGKPEQSIAGNLCPESYPDEQKTIYLSSNEVLILGEDRD